MLSPPLPVEIWRQIFRVATYVPLIFDSEWNYPPHERLWEGWQSMDDTEIQTKRTIIQVCRLWKEIGSEVLFQAIRILEHEFDRVERLIEILQRSALVSEHGYGWWTKRIECHIREFSTENTEKLALLLECCHHIQIISVTSAAGYKGPILAHLNRAIGSRFTHSLRRLDFILDEYHMNASITADLVESLPNVRLTSLSLMWGDSFQFQSLPPAFTDVTVLTLQFHVLAGQVSCEWHFPNLRSLALTNAKHSGLRMLKPFIERHHSTLVYLHLQITSSVITVLPSIMKNLPHLTTLTFDDVDICNLGGSITDHADLLFIIRGLEYLGIINIGADDDGPVNTQHGLKLILEHGVLPDLKVVRLLRENIRAVSSSENGLDWSKVVKLCEHYRIRLENMDGKPMTNVSDLAVVKSEE